MAIQGKPFKMIIKSHFISKIEEAKQFHHILVIFIPVSHLPHLLRITYKTELLYKMALDSIQTERISDIFWLERFRSVLSFHDISFLTKKL